MIIPLDSVTLQPVPSWSRLKPGKNKPHKNTKIASYSVKNVSGRKKTYNYRTNNLFDKGDLLLTSSILSLCLLSTLVDSLTMTGCDVISSSNCSDTTCSQTSCKARQFVTFPSAGVWGVHYVKLTTASENTSRTHLRA